MKKQLLGTFIVSSLFFLSCSKDASVESNGAVTFTGKISNLQAVAPGPTSSSIWNNNDEIGIFMVDNGTTVVSGDTKNRQYRFNGAQFAPLPNNEIFFPVSNTHVDFISYFPFRPAQELGNPMPINVNIQANPSTIDLLYAKSNNGGAGYYKTGNTNVPLTFDHKLSKLIIKPIPGAGLSTSDPSWNTMTIMVNGMNTMCMFDLTTGNITAPSMPGSILPFTRTLGVSYEAIVIPYEYIAPGSFNIMFNIAGNTYVLNSGSNERFESGKEYTYTVTINKTAVVLDNVSVNNWTSVTRTGVAN